MIPIPSAPTFKIELIVESAFLSAKKLPLPLTVNPVPVIIVPPSWYTAVPPLEPKLILAVPALPKSTVPPFKKTAVPPLTSKVVFVDTNLELPGIKTPIPVPTPIVPV